MIDSKYKWFWFWKNLVSKIQAVKYDLRDQYNSKEYYFIELFSGNIEIGSLVVREAFILEIDGRHYRISKVKDYDYKDLKEKKLLNK